MKVLAVFALLIMATGIFCGNPTPTSINTDDASDETTNMQDPEAQTSLEPFTVPTSSTFDDGVSLMSGEVKSRKRGHLPVGSISADRTPADSPSLSGREITEMKTSTSWNEAFQKCCSKGLHLLVMSNATDRDTIPDLQDLNTATMDECDSAAEGIVHERRIWMGVVNPTRYWLTGSKCDQIESDTYTQSTDLDVLFCRSSKTEHRSGCPEQGLAMEFTGLTAICLKHRMVTPERISPECLPRDLKYILQQKPTKPDPRYQRITKKVEPVTVKEEDDTTYFILTPETPKRGASKRRYKSAATAILPPQMALAVLALHALLT